MVVTSKLRQENLWKLLVLTIAIIIIIWPTVRNFINWVQIYFLVRKLPGPSGHFLLGNAKEYLSKEKFFNYVNDWREKYHNFNKTSIFFHPVIILQSPDAVQAVLSRKFKHSEKGFIYKGFGPLLGEGLITSKGEKWHKHRKLITPTFHFNILESFLEVLVARTGDFMVDLQEALESSTEKYIDINPYTQQLTLDFICETAMGQTSNRNKKHAEIVTAIHKLEEIGVYRIIHPWLLFSDWLFLWTAKAKEEQKYKKILHSFTDQVIKERREEFKKGNAISNDCTARHKNKAIFIDLLLASSKDSESDNKFTVQDIREEVNTFIFAGQSTTQLAINYCLYLLGRNPDIQEKAVAELKSIFGDSERVPNMDDIKKMRYLENCIKEALRLFPSVPIIARKLTENEVIDGYTLPKGSDVLVFPYVLHRDKTQFPNPEKFDPDNFLPERARKRHPYAYIPFSAGPRNCIGKKFAIIAEKTVISTVLRQYIIKSYDKQITVVPNTVLVPKSGIKLSFTARLRQINTISQHPLNITSPPLEGTYLKRLFDNSSSSSSYSEISDIDECMGESSVVQDDGGGIAHTNGKLELYVDEEKINNFEEMINLEKSFDEFQAKVDKNRCQTQSKTD
ncbi:cytochrome P450 4C1-like [Lycorma delicatula]|uniref:cytochrome P450 4C1-like n=1 Tax=Lycorma delicatula TaxID=130591 RepID=UPI003F51A428